MAILHDNQKRTFTIHTKNTTYQMQVDPYGYLLHLYYGRKAAGCMDWLLTVADRGLSGSPYDAADIRGYSMDYLPQEFPVQGTGDYRSPMLIVKDANDAFGCELRYAGYEITPGKYSLQGLPAVYAESENDHAETLKVFLEDKRLGLHITLLYGVLPELDIITRSVLVSNCGEKPFRIEKLQSACLDLPFGDFDLITFCGRHAMERQPERCALTHGSHVIGSRRGMSSHQYNPMMILADHTADERSGKCWSMQFVYSGGFKAEAERDQYNQTRMQMGLAEEKFSYPLEPGEELASPEVIMSYSGEGLAKLSHNLHRCIRKHVCRGKYRDAVRPVLLNSWEAFYFDFDGDGIVRLAKEAKELGIDLLVMDDGWFGKRNSDFLALGDWTANEEKLGCSLAELIRRVNEAGVKFGIWIEPEMVNENSDLFRAHPDWAMVIPGKKPVLGRNQLVLDLSREEVREWMYEAVCGVLDQGNIEYLKWDYNRSIADVFSHTSDDQGKVLYDYMIGLYSVLERLNERYPDVLIEGCSGGGGRFDAGMLYYTPQIWCSDNTDAVDRLIIQYGTSFGYPISAVGAHVSTCPNHQNGRVTPLKTRAAVAMNGTFGYELDPGKMTEEEKEAVRGQIGAYRKDAALIQNGDYYRLSDPVSDNMGAWAYVSEDKSQVLLCAVIIESRGNMPAMYVKADGLEPGAMYRIEEDGRVCAADALMDMGLPLPQPGEDAHSYVYHLVKI
ncbi:MAG: alpha-galactosidase [Lachnospiraceae bacterium]|nr:alpha-galactosidase [Lachnospiraceae bacterium]